MSFDELILACKNFSINVCMTLKINIFFPLFLCFFFKGNIGQARQITRDEDKKLLNENASVDKLVYVEFIVIRVVRMRCYSHDAYK